MQDVFKKVSLGKAAPLLHVHGVLAVEIAEQHPAAAVGFAKQLSDAGFEPIGVEMSELLKGGGSVKCCTLEVYS